MAEAYQRLVNAVPVTISSAFFTRSPTPTSTLLRATVQSCLPDFEHDSKRSFVQHVRFSPSEGFFPSDGFPSEQPGVSLTTPSPSRSAFVTVRTHKSGDSKQQYIEKWTDSGLTASVPVDKAHGPVCGDAWFGGIVWTADEECVLYVAEETPPKATDFFDRAPDAKGRGAKYEFQEDWGELFTGTRSPRLYAACFSTNRIVKVGGVPAHLSVGQPALSPDDKCLVYTGWSSDPRRLGMIFCFNRASSLYSVSVEGTLNAARASGPHLGDAAETKALEAATDGEGAGAGGEDPKEDAFPPIMEHTDVTPEDYTARSPVFKPEGATLCYLGSVTRFATHNSNVALRCVDLAPSSSSSSSSSFCPTGPSTTVVDTVDEAPTPEDFPGLFMGRMSPSYVFSMDGNTAVMNSMWRSRETVLAVDMTTGAVEDVGALVMGDDKVAGWRGRPFATMHCADASKDGLLLIGQSPNVPSTLIFLPRGTDGTWGTAVVRAGPEPGPAAVDVLGTMKWEVMQVSPPDGGPAYESILLLPPPTSSPPPLMVVSHGGPHSVYPAGFTLFNTFMVAQGFAILIVNYRGSLGFGRTALESLPGNAGTQDIADVAGATRMVVDMSPPVVDKDRVCCFGGSHGGFITTHLVAQHSDLFKVAGVRNPVINIATMAVSTDIPDWCRVEAGLPCPEEIPEPPTGDQLSHMWSVSPIARIRDIKAPMLILLGANDRRVPPSQGRELYDGLRKTGTPTKLCVYPNDSHPLSKPAAEADVAVRLSAWLSSHMKDNTKEA